jgi:hypothetical protein
MSLSYDVTTPVIRCGLCGHVFPPIDDCTSTCVSCLLPCDLIKCPNCGYSFPNQQTSLGRFFKKIKQKFVRKSTGE